MIEQWQVFRLDDEQLRARILEIVSNLRAFGGGVDRDRDGADPPRAEKQRHGLHAVAAHQPDAISGADAGGVQCAGRARHDFGGSAVAPRRRAADEQPLIAEAPGLLAEHGRNGAVREIEREGEMILR